MYTYTMLDGINLFSSNTRIHRVLSRSIGLSRKKKQQLRSEGERERELAHAKAHLQKV